MNATKDLMFTFLLISAFAVSCMLVGCDNKETLLDVDTPDGGGVEIERSRDTGAIDIEVDE
ncbi:hypothetical protein Poly24_49490 [Rosistilla carotiformis]|uniref:Secreted protein n=1 Tax=Rosistilla carotiformis TaxID=2528017 RepID=A0A518K0F2_9BACT|nr:hypothetical protein [Rosistilla carotiformis]QDV71215.1 hypothetical protein Poly24_49490 [Rosistilla carotiformis]